MAGNPGNPGNQGNQGNQGIWRLAGWGGAALLLLLPLLAMQVTDQVNWSPFDFAVAAALLLAAGLTLELAVRKAHRLAYPLAYRLAAVLTVAGACLLIWLNLAVGIIGSEDNPANLLYGGVLAVGIVGAVLTRGEAGGMARALPAAALVQALVGVLALAGGWGVEGAAWPLDVAGLTVFFVALFLAAALLFRQAAQRPQPA